jgi:hypothetical protein
VSLCFRAPPSLIGSSFGAAQVEQLSPAGEHGCSIIKTATFQGNAIDSQDFGKSNFITLQTDL